MPVTSKPVAVHPWAEFVPSYQAVATAWSPLSLLFTRLNELTELHFPHIPCVPATTGDLPLDCLLYVSICSLLRAQDSTPGVVLLLLRTCGGSLPLAAAMFSCMGALLPPGQLASCHDPWEFSSELLPAGWHQPVLMQGFVHFRGPHLHWCLSNKPVLLEQQSNLSRHFGTNPHLKSSANTPRVLLSNPSSRSLMKAMNFTGPTASLWKILLVTGPHAAITTFWTWQPNQFSVHFMVYIPCISLVWPQGVYGRPCQRPYLN